MKLPKEIETLIGSDEAIMIKVIAKGYPDIMSIHLLTGIPVDCIERKLAALVGLEVIVKVDGGYAINDESTLLVDRDRRAAIT